MMCRLRTGLAAGLAILVLLPGLAGCTSGQARSNLTASQATPAAPSAQTSIVSPDPADHRTMLAITEPAPGTAELVTLDARLRQILATNGYRIVPPPDYVPPGLNIFFISPEVTESEIAWIVADSDGGPLGKIAQRRIASGENNPDENLILLGAAAAADGIHQIIRKQS